MRKSRCWRIVVRSDPMACAAELMGSQAVHKSFTRTARLRNYQGSSTRGCVRTNESALKHPAAVAGEVAEHRVAARVWRRVWRRVSDPPGRVKDPVPTHH